MPRAFADRRDAGRRLARRVVGLPEVGGAAELVVLGLPRGGVPVAAEVAEALGAPLDVLVVGKVGAPGQPELALAAVADDGTVVVNRRVQDAVGATDRDVGERAGRAAADLVRRAAALRPPGADPCDLAGRVAIVVDDGMATGATMRVAVAVARARGAAEVVAAVPVAAPEAAALVAGEADRTVCVLTPRDFRAVGPWYADFTQVSDAEVRDVLAAWPPKAC